MKKQIMIVMTLGLALNAQAKFNGFNELIIENSKAQNELHGSLKEKLGDTRMAVSEERKAQLIVDAPATYNIPTNKAFMTFAKEKSYYQLSEKQVQKKLAQEVDSAE